MLEAKLVQYATVRQLEYLEAVEKEGSINKAAIALGVGRSTIQDSLKNLRRKAAASGYSPAHDMTRTVPEGYLVRGVSSLYDKDGKLSAQWVKSSIDQQRQAEMQKAALDALCEDLPRLGALTPVSGTQENLCTVYTFTDSHVGMMAWHEEGGADWNLKIAESTLIGCFERMVASSPDAKECVIAQLGDFLHYDSAVSPVTPSHGHVLDADGRMPQMVKVAIRVLRRLIDIALQKHEKVTLLLAEGNHDISSSVWLRAMFQALYEFESRINVITSELPYYTHQHGETMLAWHHGHLSKNEALPLLFASQFPKVWGNTTKRYVHTGHRHHSHEKEHPGMTVIQHPTLAARDAYAARGGWMAERAATAITYHSKYGQVARTTVVPEMMEAV